MSALPERDRDSVGQSASAAVGQGVAATGSETEAQAAADRGAASASSAAGTAQTVRAHLALAGRWTGCDRVYWTDGQQRLRARVLATHGNCSQARGAAGRAQDGPR